MLGIRPEAIDIVESGHLDGEIYGAMPTGMESTIKVRVDDFLLTGVVFGSTLFAIGSKIHVDISGDHVMLFDRRSGQCIALGARRCDSQIQEVRGAGDFHPRPLFLNLLSSGMEQMERRNIWPWSEKKGTPTNEYAAF